MRSTLEARAQTVGIETSWTDAYGHPRRLADGTLQRLLDALQPPHGSPPTHTSVTMVTADIGDTVRLPYAPGRAMPATLCDESGIEHLIQIDEHGCFQAPHRHGYYELQAASARLQLAVAPPRCFGLGDRLNAGDSRPWGLSAQVYALRRDDDGGLGDSSAVAALAHALGHAGGDALALSPLHAASRTAAVYSPYTPWHRGFLDWVYADPAQVLGTDAVRNALVNAGITAEWKHAQSSALVDWPMAYALRRMLWQKLHVQFKQSPGDLHDDLLAFARRHGEALRAHASTVAREILRSAPAHAPDDIAASAAREAFHTEMEFEIFAQWLAARCWRDTQQAALKAGQRIGLIGDLAVGCDPAGSEAWTYRDCMLKGVELGAPPDAFNAEGQSWGVSTYSPWGLQATGYRHFIELLRATMARGGGLRIDHVLGLSRLWVIPQGEPASHGGYLRYPEQDLLRLLALESWRHRCIVIGEDLGTVPPGIRDQLAARGVLGTDVLLFMRDSQGDFLPPSQWRRDALATTTTHDLPPLLGWRAALDIEQRSAVQGWSESLRSSQQQERRASVKKLDHALSQWQQQHHPPLAAFANQLSVDYVFDSPAQLALIPVDDVLDRTEQQNLPGTVHGYPNWRHRLPISGSAALQSVLQQIDRKQAGATPP